MPIDFDAIAAAFRAPLDAETHLMKPLFARMQDRLEDLARDVEKRERSMRAFPIMQWHGDALAVTVQSAQLGAIPSFAAAPAGPSLTPWQEVGRQTGRFVSELGWVGTAVEQELAIPRLLRVSVEALDIAVSSLERFGDPARAGAELFDPRAHTISDLIGELGLTFTAIVESPDSIEMFASGGEALRSAVRELMGPADSTTPDVPLPDQLREIGQWLLSGVLLLPYYSRMLLVALEAGAVDLEHALLTRLAGLELKVNAIRGSALDAVGRFVHGVGRAERWVFITATVTGLNMAWLGAMTQYWTGAVLTGVRSYLDAVSAWAQATQGLISGYWQQLEDLMSIDLMPRLLDAVAAALILTGQEEAVLGLLALRESGVLGTFTLGDLLSQGGMAAISAALTMLQLSLATIPGTAGIQQRIGALSEVLMTIALAPPIPAEAALFSLPAAGFPDIGRTIFGPGGPGDIGAALSTFGARAREAVADTLGTGQTAFAAIERRFSGAAREAAGLGSPAAYDAIARHAHEQAAGVVAGPAEEVAAEVAARRRDPVAEAFEAAVARGGIQTAASAIPAYLGEVRHYWERRPVDPTSPLILARHGRLRRVRVPRLTVHAGARSADASLAEEIGDRFRAAIGDAFSQGLRAAPEAR